MNSQLSKLRNDKNYTNLIRLKEDEIKSLDFAVNDIKWSHFL